MHYQKTKKLVLAALFAAFTAVMAQLVIPLGFTPVPFTLAIVAVFLTGAVLDWKTALLAQGCYLLLGAVGVPVFSYFGAGLAKLAGPTGLVVCYAFGTLQLMLLTGNGLWEALALAVFPFAAFDLVKAVLSSLVAMALYRALRRAQLLLWIA